MDQREQSNYQETITFGEVGTFISQGPSNDCAIDALSTNGNVSSAGDF